MIDLPWSASPTGWARPTHLRYPRTLNVATGGSERDVGRYFPFCVQWCSGDVHPPVPASDLQSCGSYLGPESEIEWLTGTVRWSATTLSHRSRYLRNPSTGSSRESSVCEIQTLKETRNCKRRALPSCDSVVLCLRLRHLTDPPGLRRVSPPVTVLSKPCRTRCLLPDWWVVETSVAPPITILKRSKSIDNSCKYF